MKNGWVKELSEKLEFFGHRNWVLVVDKAYPLQNAGGVTMIDSGEDLPETLEKVMTAIGGKKHLRPLVRMDSELDYLEEAFCPGITRMRERIGSALSCTAGKIPRLPHEEILARLADRGGLFKILVIKTETLLPYTSVFIELDCGYWDEARERKLRELMK